MITEFQTCPQCLGVGGYYQVYSMESPTYVSSWNQWCTCGQCGGRRHIQVLVDNPYGSISTESPNIFYPQEEYK